MYVSIKCKTYLIDPDFIMSRLKFVIECSH
jgi:hypothetical protein